MISTYFNNNKLSEGFGVLTKVEKILPKIVYLSERYNLDSLGDIELGLNNTISPYSINRDDIKKLIWNTRVFSVYKIRSPHPLNNEDIDGFELEANSILENEKDIWKYLNKDVSYRDFNEFDWYKECYVRTYIAKQYARKLWKQIKDILNPDIKRRMKTDSFFIKNKKRIKILIIGVLLLISTFTTISSLSKDINYKSEYRKWEKECIKASPTVYVTATGAKYHRAYHYSGRNYPMDLFTAIRHYDPCLVCNPPIGNFNSPPINPDAHPYWLLIIWVVIIAILNIYIDTLSTKDIPLRWVNEYPNTDLQ